MVTTIRDLPADVNFEMVKGDTWSKQFTVKINDVVEDITGSTFYFTIKEDAEDTDADAVFQEVITSLTDPTNGIFDISISSTDSSKFDVATFVYDLAWKNSTGTVKTLIKGKFKAKQDVTLDD